MWQLHGVLCCPVDGKLGVLCVPHVTQDAAMAPTLSEGCCTELWLSATEPIADDTGSPAEVCANDQPVTANELPAGCDHPSCGVSSAVLCTRPQQGRHVGCVDLPNDHESDAMPQREMSCLWLPALASVIGEKELCADGWSRCGCNGCPYRRKPLPYWGSCGAGQHDMGQSRQLTLASGTRASVLKGVPPTLALKGTNEELPMEEAPCCVSGLPVQAGVCYSSPRLGETGTGPIDGGRGPVNRVIGSVGNGRCAEIWDGLKSCKCALPLKCSAISRAGSWRLSLLQSQPAVAAASIVGLRAGSCVLWLCLPAHLDASEAAMRISVGVSPDGWSQGLSRLGSATS